PVSSETTNARTLRIAQIAAAFEDPEPWQLQSSDSPVTVATGLARLSCTARRDVPSREMTSPQTSSNQNLHPRRTHSQQGLCTAVEVVGRILTLKNMEMLPLFGLHRTRPLSCRQSQGFV